MVKIAIDPQQAKHIRQKYSPVPQDEDERIIDNLEQVTDKFLSSDKGLEYLLHEIAILIHRRFEFKEVAIGLLDFDGKFRYKVMQGFTSASEAARKSLAYTKADMAGDSERFPSIPIGHASEFLNGETLPEEFGIYNRPSQLAKHRESPDEFKEGDYIDTFLYGRHKEMVGWIEVSGTKDGKLPERSTLFWLEMIASVLGLLVAQENRSLSVPRMKSV